MHEHVLAKLEFPEILERLARHCRFSVAAERARELGPERGRGDGAPICSTSPPRPSIC